MNYLTLTLPFSVSDAEAKKLLSTAWLSKIASHRMLRSAKTAMFFQHPILVGKVCSGNTSSNEHKEIAKKLGLDRHTASAYLIALRGLRQNDTV